MGKDTAISWCHHTFNGWWFCVPPPDSPECANCYARAFARRVGHDFNREVRMFGDKHWAEPLKWNRDAEAAGERRRVFCGSMCDVFQDDPRLDVHRARLWALIAATPWLDWMMLTKRPENIMRMVPDAWRDAWPANAWAGTTVGCQKTVGRLEALRSVPAAVRFVSCEPMLEAIDFRGLLAWVQLAIFGGESEGRRRCELDWLRDGVGQARRSGALPFVKQLGSNPTEHGVQLRLRDSRHGANMDEWPTDLRVRCMPGVRHA